MNEAALERALNAIVERIGHGVPCPICGQEEWRPLGPLLLTLAPGSLPDAGEDAMTHGVVGLSCANCAFVRLHDALPRDA
jgi:hypothetical protein